jgi:hypothetical protein
MGLMSKRVQQALDGELPAERLDPAESAELRRYQDAVSAALRPLDEAQPVNVTTAVMRRVAEIEAARVSGRFATPWPILVAGARWLWRPRPLALTLRPASGLAFALAFAALLWAGATAPAFTEPDAVAAAPAAGAATPDRLLVQFRLADPAARQVRLVGDFTGWEPVHELHELAPGVWSVVVALVPGVYDYAFVVDGERWQLDPLAPQVADGFGGANSRVAVIQADRQL